MFIVPASNWSMTLVGLQVLVQLLCLLTVFSITRSLRLGRWIVWLYAISILAPMVPLIVTFKLGQLCT
jgi:hypothetical protein